MNRMNIEPDKLEADLSEPGQQLVIDVRSKFEYLSGHLPGAVHCPFWKLPFRVTRIAQNRAEQIVLYCEHGPRALLAQKILKLKGYNNTNLLKGHMHRWRREKRSIMK